MKRLFTTLLVIAMLTVSVCPVQARTVRGVSSGFASKSGKYIYYAFSTENECTDLMRLNTETGIKRVIVSNTKNGVKQGGFREISVKGKYIYCTWNTTVNGVRGDYIYRFTKTGSKPKRMACGRNPAVIKKRLYYDQCKKVKSGSDYYVVPTGKVYSMKFSGSGKKLEENVVLKKSVVSYNYSGKQRKVASGSYNFSISDDGRDLIRTSEDGTREVLLTYSGRISSFMAVGDYVISCGKLGRAKFVAHCTKNDGSTSVRLASFKASK